MAYHDFKFYTIGNYKIQGVTLGKGNFAKVLLATHRIVGSAVALKVYDTAAAIEEYVLKNLEREAKILSKLEHPNIVKLYEATMCRNLYCLTLECVPGGDLGEHIRKQEHRRLEEQDAKSLFYQLLSAIEHMHHKGILHRDLKLENILMMNSEVIKLADFGLSNFYCSNKVLLTRCGSPEYAAPELFISNVRYGPEVDIWSAGVILYAMVVGKVPFAYPKKCATTLEGRRQLLHAKCVKGLVEKHETAMKHLSIDCQDLLQGLIQPDQKRRMKLEEMTVHSWFVDSTKSLVLPPIPDGNRLRELHHVVLKRLSALTNIPPNEFCQLVSFGRFNKYYAMYHLLRDSMLKSSMNAGSFFSNKSIEFTEFNNTSPKPRQEISNRFNLLTDKNPKKDQLSTTKRHFEPRIHASVNIKPKVTREGSTVATETPSTPTNNDKRITEGTIQKNKPSDTKRYLPKCTIALKSRNRNVLLKSICDKQKAELSANHTHNSKPIKTPSVSVNRCGSKFTKPSPGNIESVNTPAHNPSKGLVSKSEECKITNSVLKTSSCRIRGQSSDSTKAIDTSPQFKPSMIRRSSTVLESKEHLPESRKKFTLPHKNLNHTPLIQVKRNTLQRKSTNNPQHPVTILKRPPTIIPKNQHPPVTILRRPQSAVKCSKVPYVPLSRTPTGTGDNRSHIPSVSKSNQRSCPSKPEDHSSGDNGRFSTENPSQETSNKMTPDDDNTTKRNKSYDMRFHPTTPSRQKQEEYSNERRIDQRTSYGRGWNKSRIIPNESANQHRQYYSYVYRNSSSDPIRNYYRLPRGNANVYTPNNRRTICNQDGVTNFQNNVVNEDSTKRLAVSNSLPHTTEQLSCLSSDVENMKLNNCEKHDIQCFTCETKFQANKRQDNSHDSARRKDVIYKQYS